MLCMIDSKINVKKNNDDKCHVLVSTKKSVGIKIGDIKYIIICFIRYKNRCKL